MVLRTVLPGRHSDALAGDADKRASSRELERAWRVNADDGVANIKENRQSIK